MWPEYTTEKNTFVDYALLINGIPLIFIEVKHRLEGENKRREALKQLLEYAFSEGVPIAILTDGDLWAFYWPAAPGKMEERLVAEVQLTQTDPAVCAQLLSQYLQKQGASSEKLLEKMQSALQARKIPLILKSIFHSPSDKLLDLLQKEAESRGYTSLTHDQIRAFLQEWMTFPPRSPLPNQAQQISPDYFCLHRHFSTHLDYYSGLCHERLLLQRPLPSHEKNYRCLRGDHKQAYTERPELR